MHVAQLVFNLKYRLYRPKTLPFFRQLQRSQYWSQEQWLQYEREKCDEVVLRAYSECDFYKKFYGSAGFQAGDVEQDNYFEKLPVLKKQHLRSHFDEIVNSKAIQKLGVAKTGGSTGVPVRCGFDKTQPVEAYGWRTLSWWGLTPADSGGYVWRNPRQTLRSQWLNQVVWWPTRKIRLDASSMTPLIMRTFLCKWNKVKPPQLQGYVGAVAELAQFIDDHSIDIHYPRAVWVTSAPLSAGQRSLLERVFHAPVYDQYGCCELPWIAAQCEQNCGLHVNTEKVRIGFVDEADREVARGDWGRTLITRYDDFVFPLIRYELGDTGRFLTSLCACKRTLPLIDQVKGRTTDVIRLPSGRFLSGEYLTTIFDAYPDAICGFRVIQRKDHSICVEYIPVSSDNSARAVAMVKQDLTVKVHNEVPLNFKEVSSIPHDRGKLRFVIREQ